MHYQQLLENRQLLEAVKFGNRTNAEISSLLKAIVEKLLKDADGGEANGKG